MKLIYLFSVLGLLYACNTTHKLNDNVIDENIEFAYKQIGNEIQAIEKSGKFMNPVTLGKDGRTYYCKYTDWRSGFFQVRYGISTNSVVIQSYFQLPKNIPKR